MVIVLALMTHSCDRHGLIAFDLEQNDIACRTERDQQLPQKRVAPLIIRFAAGEGENFEKLDSFVNGGFSACSYGNILLQQKIKQAQQIIFGFQSEADAITHFTDGLLLAFFNLALSLLSTFLAETYSPRSEEHTSELQSQFHLV